MKNKSYLFAALLTAHFLFFALVFFPFSYFRHDDWLILGNALFVLPKNWGSALSPTLFYGNQEVVWFLRPLFKIFVYVFYQLFALNYYAWLCGIWGFFALGMVCLKKCLQELEVSESWVLITTLAFLPFPFGSLVWMGEGMMNCPQFFFFMLAFWLFLKNVSVVFTLAAFLLAVGFKESAAIFPLFLTVILFTQKKFRLLSPLVKIKKVLPLWVVALVYLAVRLKFMPIHPGYHPVMHWSAWLKPLLYLGIGPAVIVIFNRWLLKSSVKFNWASVGFLGCLCLPYLGHGFFSYGWLLLPGVLFIFLWGVENSTLTVKKSYGITLALLATIPLLGMLYHEGWWQWGKGQRALVEQIRQAPETTRALVIRECENPNYPKAKFERVVGFEAGIDFLWKLKHDGKSLQAISRMGCDEKRTLASDALILRWQFPNLQKD